MQLLPSTMFTAAVNVLFDTTQSSLSQSGREEEVVEWATTSNKTLRLLGFLAGFVIAQIALAAWAGYQKEGSATLRSPLNRSRGTARGWVTNDGCQEMVVKSKGSLMKRTGTLSSADGDSTISTLTMPTIPEDEEQVLLCTATTKEKPHLSSPRLSNGGGVSFRIQLLLAILVLCGETAFSAPVGAAADAMQTISVEEGLQGGSLPHDDDNESLQLPFTATLSDHAQHKQRWRTGSFAKEVVLPRGFGGFSGFWTVSRPAFRRPAKTMEGGLVSQIREADEIGASEEQFRWVVDPQVVIEGGAKIVQKVLFIGLVAAFLSLLTVKVVRGSSHLLPEVQQAEAIKQDAFGFLYEVRQKTRMAKKPKTFMIV